MKVQMAKSSEKVFRDIGFLREEAEHLLVRADLMIPSQSGGNRAVLSLNGHSVIGFENAKASIKFQRLFVTVLGGSQHFASGHGRHVVRHTIRKHQPSLLNDNVKLMDQPPVRVGSTHQ